MSRQTRMILLVEDSEDDAELAVRAFRGSGLDCKIVRMGDGRRALEYLSDFGRHDPGMPLGLVLLDLKLPDLSGLEVLRELRRTPRAQRVPVVVMSCSGEQSDIDASYDLGANSYIRKPVDFVEFARAIEALGTYWLSLNELSPGGRLP